MSVGAAQREAGRLRQWFASTDPETFIQGLKIAAARPTAAPIELHVTRITSAPASSAQAMWSTTRRAVRGVSRPFAITS